MFSSKTKMNYDRRNNTTPHFQSSRVRTGMSSPTKVVIGCVVLLAILYAFLPNVLPSLFLSVVNPLWKADLDARNGTLVREELERVFNELRDTSLKNDALFIENEALKAGLERVHVEKPVLGTIIKKPPYSAYDSYILDVGANEGIKEGQRVSTLSGIPIGEIAEVIGGISRVKLYSSFGEKFDVLIGPLNIEATAIGKGGGYFEVSLPRDTKIKKGDTVHIPTLTDSFVGTVDGLASEPSEPFAKLLFHQPVNIYEQRWVIIDTQ
jgi:cell shape-determining protein MreC